MLVLLLDMVVLWGALNYFSADNWDDEKLKVFGIAFGISFLGGAALTLSAALVFQVVGFVGAVLIGLGVFFLVGWGLLIVLAGVTPPQGASIMGIFVAYKFVIQLLFSSMLN